MAFAASCVWEVRTTGNDANGGGFDPTSGTPGTDYSQQDSPQVTYTDLVIDGTTNTKCTSASTPFTAAHVGNIINITSGTGFTVQRVQVMSVAANVATCDKSLGTLGSTGGNGNLGGALATPTTAVPLMVGGNTCYLKNGIASFSSTLTPPSGTGAAPTRLYGYGTSRNDGTQCTLTAGAAITIITLSNTDIHCKDLDADCNSTGTRCFDSGSGSRNIAINCKARRFTAFGFNGVQTHNCRATGGTSAATAAFNNGFCIGSQADANACPGFRATSSMSWIRCLSFDNTGASTDGFISASTSFGVVLNCTSHNNARDGLRFDASNGSRGAMVYNSVFTNNGGYGIRSATDNILALAADYNAFGGGASANTSGARLNVPTGAHDLTLTGTPFTNTASGDFSLDNTAGEGGAMRAAAFPGAFPAGTTTGYLDIGAVQHQDAGGGGAVPRFGLASAGPSFRGAGN